MKISYASICALMSVLICSTDSSAMMRGGPKGKGDDSGQPQRQRQMGPPAHPIQDFDQVPDLDLLFDLAAAADDILTFAAETQAGPATQPTHAEGESQTSAGGLFDDVDDGTGLFEALPAFKAAGGDADEGEERTEQPQGEDVQEPQPPTYHGRMLPTFTYAGPQQDLVDGKSTLETFIQRTGALKLNPQRERALKLRAVEKRMMAAYEAIVKGMISINSQQLGWGILKFLLASPSVKSAMVNELMRIREPARRELCELPMAVLYEQLHKAPPQSKSASPPGEPVTKVKSSRSWGSWSNLLNWGSKSKAQSHEDADDLGDLGEIWDQGWVSVPSEREDLAEATAGAGKDEGEAQAQEPEYSSDDTQRLHQQAQQLFNRETPLAEWDTETGDWLWKQGLNRTFTFTQEYYTSTALGNVKEQKMIKVKVDPQFLEDHFKPAIMSHLKTSLSIFHWPQHIRNYLLHAQEDRKLLDLQTFDPISRLWHNKKLYDAVTKHLSQDVPSPLWAEEEWLWFVGNLGVFYTPEKLHQEDTQGIIRDMASLRETTPDKVDMYIAQSICPTAWDQAALGWFIINAKDKILGGIHFNEDVYMRFLSTYREVQERLAGKQ